VWHGYGSGQSVSFLQVESLGSPFGGEIENGALVDNADDNVDGGGDGSGEEDRDEEIDKVVD